MLVKRLIVTLIFWLASGLPALAQESNNKPLDPPEIRQVIGFMIELEDKDAKLKLAAQQLEQEKAFEARQDALAARELDLQKQTTVLAEHARDIEKTRADEYQALWKESTRKVTGGFGCHIKKIFTLGLGKCT